ncbi:MAG TPA: polysaccharide biosynthesis tyrosine autokinase [Acidobacteriaceae bacterium]|nr:polysaccharide biosynthesis tyrosine autokinase [Acidobacteriaceae bacterium]
MNSPGHNVPDTSEFTPRSFQTGGGWATNEEGNALSENLLTLRKRKWIVIAAVFIGGVFGVVKAVTTPKVYTAGGTIQVRPGAANEYRVSGQSGMGQEDLGVRLETEVSILQSSSLLLKVAEELKLEDNPVFLGPKATVHHLDPNDRAVQEQMIGFLSGGLAIHRIPKTEIIDIEFTSLSPKLSAEVVNTLIQDYVERSFQTRYASTQRVSQWLQSQLNDLRQNVESSQVKLEELQKKLGVLRFSDQTHDLEVTTLDNLTRAASDAKIHSILAEARYRMLTSANPDLIDGSPNVMGSSNASLLATLRNQETSLETQYAQLSSQYGPNYPTVRQLQAEMRQNQKAIDLEEKRVVAQAKTEYETASKDQTMTQSMLDNEISGAYKLRDDMAQYVLLQREFESNRTLYEGLLSRLREAGIEAGLTSSEIDVIDVARIPMLPSGMRRLSRVMVGLMFGLFGGVALAFFTDSLDTSLRTVHDIETISELPSLAVIPRARKLLPRTIAEDTRTAAMKNVDVLGQPNSQFAEAFRSLRTALMLSGVGQPPQVVLVTSSTPAEGKSTIATNLATVLAFRDAKVLLIDADLRRPTIHSRFGISGKIGLSTVLSGSTPFDDALQTIPEIPNLYMLSSGPVPPFPTELIASKEMSDLILHCRGRFTHIVIDSPPILTITDGIVLAPQCDAVLLVVRYGRASKHSVRRARDLMLRSAVRMGGTVINAVDTSSQRYYGYYGYQRYSYFNDRGPGEQPAQPRKWPFFWRKEKGE